MRIIGHLELRLREVYCPWVGAYCHSCLGLILRQIYLDIRQAINGLSGNQQTVVLLFEEQMTILSVSRVHNAEHHQALLDLVE